MRILLCSLAVSVFALFTNAQKKTFNIPLLNNTYIKANQKSDKDVLIGKDGLTFFDQTNNTATMYVYLKKGAKYILSLEARGKGVVGLAINNLSTKPYSKKIHIISRFAKNYSIGNISPQKDGYIKVEFKLLSLEDTINIKYLNVITQTSSSPVYLSEDFNSHFGLRGPSCHLSYNTGQYKKDIEWALVDVQVPLEFDMTGSYYMALGFQGGYFGFQNNSANRRQVLFSVWNSIDDDDPYNVAKEHQTRMIKHGDGVTVKDFGHEGSGKQSFIKIDWKPNVTYRFLLHAYKSSSTTTDYSAWFYDTIGAKWIFMATLRRPNCTDLISGLHSFLENFNPEQGDKTRKAYYSNVWIKPKNDNWKPIVEARLTNDLTGSKGIRLDFNGGVEGYRFFLVNGGYFDRAEVINRQLLLENNRIIAPELNLEDILQLSK